MKKILLLIIFLSANNIIFAQSIKLTPLDFNLEDGYSYTYQSLSLSNLTFVEDYTNTVYVYDLKSDEIIVEKKIPKGRGPGEANMINAAVFYENKLYIGVAPEFKIIVYDLLANTFTDHYNRSISPRSFMIFNEKLIVENDLKDKLFLSVDIPLHKEIEFQSIDFLNIDPLKEFTSNFFKEGTQTVIEDKLIFSTQYKSNLYLFDLNKMSYEKKIEFDISTVSMPRTISSGGSSITLAPNDANIEIKGIGFSDYFQSHTVFLLLSGKGAVKSYTLDRLYLYDTKKEMFTDEFDLPFEADKILSGNSEIVLVDNDSLKLYKVDFRDE